MLARRLSVLLPLALGLLLPACSIAAVHAETIVSKDAPLEGMILSFFILAFVVALAIVRLFHLPIQWIGYATLGLLVVGVCLNSLLDAKGNPWILWKRNWMQYAGEAEQFKLGKYTMQADCLKDQWEKLTEELEQKKHIAEIIKLPNSRKVFLVEGRTIFQFGPSLYSRMPDVKSRALADLNENKELSAYQKEQMAYEMLLPEIVSSVSFFCAPSLKWGFWPYYTPAYYAPTDDLRRLGEKTLAARAKKMLDE